MPAPNPPKESFEFAGGLILILIVVAFIICAVL